MPTPAASLTIGKFIDVVIVLLSESIAVIVTFAPVGLAKLGVPIIDDAEITKPSGKPDVV